jgi:hypothetical protein
MIDATKAAALLLAALLAALAACRAPAPRAAPDRAPAPPVMHEPEDGSYDWHGLLIAPFGSALKEIPATLHEVLLFRDAEQSTAAAEDAECYAADAPAPRFVGRIPEQYLLCFKHDRLSRIQASVILATAEAADVFSAACAGWLKHAAPATPDAAVPAVAAPAVAATAGAAPPAAADGTAAASAACEGSDAEVRFSARLEEDAGQTVLSMALDSVPDP